MWDWGERRGCKPVYNTVSPSSWTFLKMGKWLLKKVENDTSNVNCWHELLWKYPVHSACLQLAPRALSQLLQEHSDQIALLSFPACSLCPLFSYSVFSEIKCSHYYLLPRVVNFTLSSCSKSVLKGSSTKTPLSASWPAECWLLALLVNGNRECVLVLLAPTLVSSAKPVASLCRYQPSTLHSDGRSI